MIAPAYRSGITRAAFWATDDIPSLTVGTSCSQWPAARAQSARAFTQPFDTEGPATFTPPTRPPASPAVHAIFVVVGLPSPRAAAHRLA